MNARLLLLLLFFALPAWPQGFAGLGTATEGFAEVTQGTTITFPEGYAAHPEFRIEWWYLTANLTAADGREFGVQWTLFRTSLAPGPPGENWQDQNIWIGHAALTSAKTHRFAEKFARGGVGQAGVTIEPFKAWIDDWSMIANPDNSLSLTASAEDFAYTLRLQRTGPPVLQGDAGYSLKSTAGQASYYFSEPFLNVTGTISTDGEDIPVTGAAWLDREWSSQPLDARQSGWDWMALHLDSGEKLMVFRLRGADGDNFRAGTWITADGTPEPIQGDAISLEPLETAAVADRQVPIRWRLDIPSRNLSVEITALNPASWMATLFPYWEGPMRFTGSHSGRGYLEMTGYEP
jgi:predicted secreted hydrolase